MEKRMAGDYEIIHAFHIGDREIVLGESLNCNPGERYDVMISDDCSAGGRTTEMENDYIPSD